MTTTTISIRIPAFIVVPLLQWLIRWLTALYRHSISHQILRLLRDPAHRDGLTSPEIASLLCAKPPPELVEDLLNPPLATGEVVGWFGRLCRISNTMKNVYWINQKSRILSCPPLQNV